MAAHGWRLAEAEALIAVLREAISRGLAGSTKRGMSALWSTSGAGQSVVLPGFVAVKPRTDPVALLSQVAAP